MNARPQSIGPYRVLDELGRGAHGVVYRGRHEESGQLAAIKTVEGVRAERLQSLRREIHALSRIEHPGIARILGQGVEDGRPWCAMELVAGEDLAEHCSRLWSPPSPNGEPRPHNVTTGKPTGERRPSRRPKIPVKALREILGLIRQLCAPLAYLHGQGLVHRDLKPRNILVRGGEKAAASKSRGGPEAGVPVLVDFGLVSEFGGPLARAALEVGGVVVGTLAYSAPEQLEGRLVDARADLYALGSILYALLTGRPVFGTLAEVLDPDQMPAPPSTFVAGVSERLDELVLGLLEKVPARRIGHADLVSSALVELGARNGGATGPVPRVYLYRPALTGRAELLQELGRKLSESLRSGRGKLIFLGGESGIGKTRLAVEVASRFQRQGLQVLTGECTTGASRGGESAKAAPRQGAAGAPLQPMLTVLQWIADRCRERGDAETTRLLGVRGPVLAQYEPALRNVPGHVSWTEPEKLPPEEARLRLFRYLAQTLTELVGGEPLLLVLDDLQWADELTLAFLQFANRTGLFDRTRLVVLATYRSEDVSEMLATCLDSTKAERIELRGLEAGAVSAMAADMLGLSPVPELLERSLATHTDGNPFFVAEYLRVAVEDALLSRDRHGRWEVAQAAMAEAWTALPLPGSVRDLVGRRLAGLPPAALQLVQAASVLGKQSSTGLLGRIVELDETEFLEATTEAVRRQVLEEAGEGSLRFVHDQIREVAYGGIAPAARPRFHRNAATAIEDSDSLERGRQLAGLGRHWEEAGELTLARERYLEAARREQARYAHIEAERLYRSGLRLFSQPSQESIEAQQELATRVLEMRGRSEEALALMRDVVTTSHAVGLPACEARGLRWRGTLHYYLGQLEEARRDAEASIELFRRLGDTSGEADALDLLGLIVTIQGRLDEAKAHHSGALELLRRSGDRLVMGRVLGNLGIVAWHRGEMDGALRFLREAIEIDRSIGNQRQEAIRLSHIGGIMWSQGKLQESRQLYNQALELQREIGDRRWESQTLSNLGATAWTEGQLEEARECYEKALAIDREIGDRRLEAIQMSNLGCIHRDQGNVRDGRQLLIEALDLHRTVGNKLFEVETLVELAVLERRSAPDLKLAEALVSQALVLAESMSDGLKVSRCLCESGHLAVARGCSAREDLARAEKLIAAAGASESSEFGKATARLRRALEAFESGHALIRGELESDIPKALRRT